MAQDFTIDYRTWTAAEGSSGGVVSRFRQLVSVAGGARGSSGALEEQRELAMNQPQ